nr:Gag-Pol polyprotein [Tanacetum cinerariifolium]
MAAKFEIEKLNGNNFSLWKLKTKAILTKDKCLAAIDERPAEVIDDSKWDEMDINAITNLHLALTNGVLSSIEEKRLQRIFGNILLDYYLVFDDVATVILEDENRHNNMEDKKKNFKCYKCGKPGHCKKDYRGLNTSYPQGNVASTSEDGNALCCEITFANKSKNLLSLGQSDDLGCKRTEIYQLFKKHWIILMRRSGRKSIRNKWVYKIKRNGDDQVERYRARVVVKGYAQKEGVDFNEIFSSWTSVPIITSANTTTPTVDPAAIAKEKLVGSSVFCANSPSAGGSHPIPGGFSDCTGSDFLIRGIRTVIDPDSNLQKVYVPQWNVTNGSCLDDGGVFHEMVDEFAPLSQMSLSAEVRMHAKYNIRERRRLNSVIEEKDALLKAKDEENRSLKAQLVLKEAEAAEAVHLRTETSNFKAVEKFLQSEVAALKERNNLLEIEKSRLDVKVADLAATVKVREQEVADLDVVVTSVKLQNDNLVDQEKVMAYENYLSQLEKFQDDRISEMNDKFDKLDTDLVEMALHLEERFYPHLLTTISGPAIGKAVEKVMQDGLYARITHGAKGRVLTDVASYNPSTKDDYLSALQHLQSVNFSLIAELKSNKDASIDAIINLLRLEDSVAEKLGLTESQPHVDQLMVPIHHSPDQRVVGASALSLSLDVSSSRVRRIKDNIAKHRSALRDVFVPLSEPLSVMALMGTKSTLNVIPATVDTITALSVTSVSTSLIPLISKDDYEITHAEDEKSVGVDANPFPDVDDAELTIPQ